MKRKYTLLWFIFLLVATGWGQVTHLVFNGQSLQPYAGQTVLFDQTLHVVGRYYTDSYSYLYLSYERLRQPEECAVQGTAAYDSIAASHENAIITARCYNLDVSTVRLGATLQQLQAEVLSSGPRNIRIDGPQSFGNNERPTQRPDVGNARLIICESNLEYYCPDWEDTYGAGSDEEFERQHLKTVKALANIGADLYALEELQQGREALAMLVEGLNARTAPGRYAAVEDFDSVTSTYIKTGFIYRTDKLRPVLHLGHPYHPGASSYLMQAGDYKRELVQCFEELATGERFVVCANHFKSKSGGDSTNNYYNANRVLEAQYLLDFLETEQNNNYYGDADVLILGDLNCGTREEPIRLMEENGYENVVSIYSPDGYSYAFNDEVEYLDHVLASPTMSEQITGVSPYHINADEPYQLHYNYSEDTSMYRYSDHDPIIIGVTLESQPAPSADTLHYFESFAQSMGCFEPVNVAGDAYWYGYSNYECAYMNAYSSGANTDWLVGPTFDLTNMQSATFAFTHTLGYGTLTTWPYFCKLLISKDYNGDLNEATWAQLPIPHWPASNWNWQTNTISIPAGYLGQPTVTLAFLYESLNGNDVPTWEIKNVSFNAGQTPTGIQENAGESEAPFSVRIENGKLMIDNVGPYETVIYDMAGRVLERCVESPQIVLPLPSSGTYIVSSGGYSQKIVITNLH
jgi:hypothetical protein